MNQARLRWLLAVMGGLLVVRLLVPNPGTEVAVAQALVRAQPSRPVSVAAPAPPAVAVPESTNPEPDVPGNAFAVRRPAVPAAKPSLPPMVPQLAAVAPPPPPVIESQPPPPPPPPFRVIGTWDDGVAPGLFVSTPVGTQLARIGTVLLAEYRVTAITPRLLSLEHMSTKQAHQLNVPRGTSP